MFTTGELAREHQSNVTADLSNDLWIALVGISHRAENVESNQYQLGGAPIRIPHMCVWRTSHGHQANDNRTFEQPRVKATIRNRINSLSIHERPANEARPKPETKVATKMVTRNR
jgi:hypothetical protein